MAETRSYQLNHRCLLGKKYSLVIFFQGVEVNNRKQCVDSMKAIVYWNEDKELIFMKRKC